jgi:hypothetical protein
VHQDAADRVRPQAPRLVTPAVDALRDPDRIRVLALIAELGRVMKHENRTLGRNRCAHASIENDSRSAALDLIAPGVVKVKAQIEKPLRKEIVE